jgi:hypothetical protein
MLEFRNQDYRAEPYEGICEAAVRDMYGRISAGNSGLMAICSGKLVEKESVEWFGAFWSFGDGDGGGVGRCTLDGRPGISSETGATRDLSGKLFSDRE